MKCENCGSKHNGNYGSGRFCCQKCARSFSTKNKRDKINAKISKTLGGTKWTLKEKKCLYCGNRLIKNQRKFCNNICFHNYKYLIYINKWKLNLEKGLKGKLGTSSYIKKYFLYKYNNKCQKCGWCKINPTTGKVPLELHHKDGNYKNNKEENLELLCPNCHSITSTYKALNIKCTRNYIQKR